jgi:hypothetical protein
VKCRKPKCPNDRLDSGRFCQEHWNEAIQKAKDKLESCTVIGQGEDPCWLWTGHKQQSGYGYMSSYGLAANSKPVHWMALLVAEGGNFDINSHGEIHHTCRSIRCVNPKHLFHMRTEFHELLHQLSNSKVAHMVIDHLLEAYPYAVKQIKELRKVIP